VEIGLAVVGSSWQKSSLKQELLARFDAVVLPRRYRFVESLPREPSGKISRQRLLALFAESSMQDRED
jgi:acyl-coenzyme A synthetase/AMP-(fatty) acid ligase